MQPLYFLQLILLCIAYVATARLGLSLETAYDFASLVWVPAGVAIVALYLYGYRLAPAILLGAFAANFAAGAHPFVAGGIAFGNTLEALAGSYLLHRFVGEKIIFATVKESIGFIILAAGAAPFFAATIGVGSLVLGGIVPEGEYITSWLTWWLGDALGTLVVGAFLLYWLTRLRFHKTVAEIMEGFAMFGFLIAVNLIVFWSPLSNEYAQLTYLLFAPLIWAAIRGGPRGTTLSLVITWVIALSAAYFGAGPFEEGVLLSSLFPLQLFMGVVSVIFLIFTSIVEDRKAINRQLKAHVDQLEAALHQVRSADRAKNEFLAILAHELRNPLAPVVSSLELIKLKGRDVPDFSGLIDMMDSRVKTMARLLEDLLDITRISRKQFKLNMETVSLQEALARAIQTVLWFMTSRNHTLHSELPHETIWLHADLVRLEQIFNNLLYNAAKYTEPGGDIRITCTTEGRFVKVSIKDTGIGIPPQMQKKIFEPFVQIGQKARVGTGLGLGLSLTEKLVKLHDGSIEVKSEGLGCGSEFIVCLPVPASLQLQIPLTEKKKKEGGTNTKPFRVIVVDDNEAAAEGLQKLLAAKGHQVKTAYDGTSALLSISAFQPDMVILDIGLPDIDGYEVAKRLRAVKEDAPPYLIAVTGYGLEEDKEKARSAGFDYHLTKPVSIEELEAVFEKIAQ